MSHAQSLFQEPRVPYQLYNSTHRANISLFDNKTSSVLYQLRAPASQDPSDFYKKQHSPTSATVHAKQELSGPNHPADSGLSSRQRPHHAIKLTVWLEACKKVSRDPPSFFVYSFVFSALGLHIGVFVLADWFGTFFFVKGESTKDHTRHMPSHCTPVVLVQGTRNIHRIIAALSAR